MPTPVSTDPNASMTAGLPGAPPVTQELPLVTPKLERAMLVEQTELRREVLLWQRWVRYLGIGMLALVSIVFTTNVEGAVLPLVVIVGVYLAIVTSTAWMLRHMRSTALHASFPWVLALADVAAIAGCCYLSSAPQQLDRILLLGLLPVQVAAFYFGRRHGAFAAALAIVAFLVLALFAAPFVDGPAATRRGLVFDVALFAVVSAVLIYTFGSFRQRMVELRTYCKVIELGENVALPRLGTERWPDELTLLGRSFRTMHARLAEQIGSDPLTGCMNRRSLESRLRSELRHARRRNSTVAVVALDIDNFKTINDTHGHPAGDVVLQQVAAIMKVTVRDTDVVARIGGDEFLIVLPDAAWQGAVAFAERLRRRVDEHQFGFAGTPIEVTVSVGLALGRGRDSISSELLLKEADAALYKAKTAGRNRVLL